MASRSNALSGARRERAYGRRRATAWLLGLTLGAALTGDGLAAEPAAGPARSARLNYILHCQGCHLPDGSGSPGKVPDMRGEVSQFLTIPGGREYLVQVPGAATSRLSDGELADLLNWLVKTMGPPPPSGFKPYSQAEVSRLRPNWLQDPKQLRTRLLSAFAPARPPAATD